MGVKESFSAVINPPHAYHILAVGAGEQRPVVKGSGWRTGQLPRVECSSRSVDRHRARRCALERRTAGRHQGSSRKPMECWVKSVTFNAVEHEMATMFLTGEISDSELDLDGGSACLHLRWLYGVCSIVLAPQCQPAVVVPERHC